MGPSQHPFAVRFLFASSPPELHFKHSVQRQRVKYYKNEKWDIHLTPGDVTSNRVISRERLQSNNSLACECARSQELNLSCYILMQGLCIQYPNLSEWRIFRKISVFPVILFIPWLSTALTCIIRLWHTTAKSLPMFRADCLQKETVPQINTLTGFGIPHCEPGTVLGQFW